MIALFNFIHEHRDKLHIDQKTLFIRTALREIHIKKALLSKGIIVTELNKAQNRTRKWKCSYHERKELDATIAKGTILINIYGVIDILGHYLSYLQEENRQKKIEYGSLIKY